MATNLEIIFACLKNSDLDRKAQERFLGMCAQVGDGGLENLAQTLRDYPEELPAMMKIMDLKWQALNSRDADVFKQVLQAEIEEIKKSDTPE